MRMQTPWGPAQSELFFHPERKIVQVSTAEHGGVGVSVDLAMPEYFTCLGLNEDDGWLWFEEDVMWAVPAVAFPLYFKPDWVEGAKQTLRDEFPEAYTSHFGEVLTAATSRALERREWERQTVNNFVVTAAFGDWAFDVPTGHVYITGFRRSDEATAGFLLREDQYVRPGRLVLDGFPRWEPDRTKPYLKPRSHCAVPAA